MPKDKTEDKKKDSGPKNPKGPLPKKQRLPMTTGKRGEGEREERYCPSKRLKTAHRKFEKKVSLRDFASGFGDRQIVKDWIMNKKASGRA